ncbi:MAG: 3-phosphoshikimate 1-carboxyvinyltransferase, partial [Bacteroidia bacterium]|nr:3-phosphoshikimate 1-carboxyvinyltransferase [Bacteroidia bacterium]
VAINLSGSKSISNRLLLLNKILKAGWTFENLSDSEDTQLLKLALEKITSNKTSVIDVNHAGTDFRFLTALLAITEGPWVLTGSERLKERPIGPLVTALQNLGANICYLEKNGYPPLEIAGKELSGGSTSIDAGISSQFVSALLLIAPSLKNGLSLHIKGKMVSEPYLEMTIGLMKLFGIEIERPLTGFHVSHQAATSVNQTFYVEPDWSSASYWYSICALSKNCRVFLKGLAANSLQADSVLPKLYEALGVKTEFKNNGVEIFSQPINCSFFEYDFTSCPDIAQTLAVSCFGLGIGCKLMGLKTLRIKETDRIAALKTELEKLGAKVEAGEDWLAIPATQNSSIQKNQVLETYHDHRMAMSFAPLALCIPGLHIGNPEVVNKSYPAFWADLKSAGFSVNLQP